MAARGATAAHRVTAGSSAGSTHSGVARSTHASRLSVAPRGVSAAAARGRAVRGKSSGGKKRGGSNLTHGQKQTPEEARGASMKRE